MNAEFQKQLDECDHEPFIHNLLNGTFECLCGKVARPIGGWCPSDNCLCSLPKTKGLTNDQIYG